MTRRSFDDPDSIEARQALLDNRGERKHPKRHRTRKRASKHSRAKRAAAKQAQTATAKRARKLKNETRAYWLGRKETHP